MTLASPNLGVRKLSMCPFNSTADCSMQLTEKHCNERLKMGTEPLQ